MNSIEPNVRLLAFTAEPLKLSVASARTCYSNKIVLVEELKEEQKERISKLLFESGHHTPFQHPTFVFGLENVSRHFVWSFLHSHPFYNSEQSSQRYVKLKEIKAFIPPIKGNNKTIFKKALKQAWNNYFELTELMKESMHDLFLRLGKIKKISLEQTEKELEKKAIENARYVLPIAAFTELYHTISGLELMRYIKMMNSNDTPFETSLIIKKMIEEINKIDESFTNVCGKAFNEEIIEKKLNKKIDFKRIKKENQAFDEKLNGLSAKLEFFDKEAEKKVAFEVKRINGAFDLNDNEAIDLIVNPAKNKLLLEPINCWMHSPSMKPLNNVFYSFAKKLSHSADSQEQRHRTLSTAKPLLSRTHSFEPDFIIPKPLKQNKEAFQLFNETMQLLWNTKNELIENEVKDEFAVYVLPNAVSIRFHESGSLLNFMHKWRLRTCFNAQHEISKSSLEELMQVKEKHPLLVKYVGPACYYRKGLVKEDSIKGPCPEFSWCGIKTWLNFPKVERPY
jgi:flavin-dependent thymidylate synthase